MFGFKSIKNFLKGSYSSSGKLILQKTNFINYYGNQEKRMYLYYSLNKNKLIKNTYIGAYSYFFVENSIIISELNTSEKFRKKGICTKIINLIIEDGNLNNVENIKLVVDINNIKNIKYYQKMGFIYPSQNLINLKFINMIKYLNKKIE